MFCYKCGKEIEDVHYCPYCGVEQTGFPKVESSSSAESPPKDDEVLRSLKTPEESEARSAESSMPRAKKILLANCAVFAVLLVLVGVGLGTAVRWEKVDVPAHKETFHTEQRDSGMWNVKDDHTSPCYVNQDWTDCINLYINEYNGACAERNLTPFAKTLCDKYSENIDRMEAEDGPYYYVATLGSFGHLTAEKVYTSVNVSNNDYIPAQTHEALCIFGFIGECDFENEL